MTAFLDARLVSTVGEFSLDVTLRAAAGSVVALLGPNGAGKTTAIELIAGHRRLADGRLAVDGRELDRPAAGVFVEAGERRVGHVPQDLLLFPHLSVLRNVAFGPRSRGASRKDADATAAGWLERLDLADFADRRPHELSGGQAQRVALARALAANPDILLLDEPLAALDVAARSEVRRDLRRHLASFSGVVVIVTHDPVDALLLADEVVVVEGGRVTQNGSTVELTARPRTPYVAQLVGTNLFSGAGRGTTVELRAAGATPCSGTLDVAESVDGAVFVTVAPRAVALHSSEPVTSARNVWPAVVTNVELVGERARVTLDGSPPIVAEITARTLAERRVEVGDHLWVSVKSTEIDAYPN